MHYFTGSVKEGIVVVEVVVLVVDGERIQVCVGVELTLKVASRTWLILKTTHF
jgi:hypothetical protein